MYILPSPYAREFECTSWRWARVRIERGRERIRDRGLRREGAHLHAEPQSDCGAHRLLARFVPSFLNRRHWDSAWKVKTDFSAPVLTPSCCANDDATNFFTFTPFSYRSRLKFRALPFLRLLFSLFPHPPCCVSLFSLRYFCAHRDFRSSLRSLNSIEWICSCRKVNFSRKTRVIACRAQ